MYWVISSAIRIAGQFSTKFLWDFKKIERSKISENLLRYCYSMWDTVRRWTLLKIFECSTVKFFAKDFFLYYGVSSPEFSEQFLSSWKSGFFLSDLNRLSCAFLSDRKGKFFWQRHNNNINIIWKYNIGETSSATQLAKRTKYRTATYKKI